MATMIVVGMVVLAVTATGLGVLIGRNWPDARPTVTGQPPATTTAAPPSPAGSPSPTGTRPSPSASASSGGDVYADLPQVVANPVYDLAPRPLECDGLQLPVPEGDRLERWSQQAMRCLREHYAPVVAEAGATLTAPTLTFYDDEVDTPCGDDATGAFYCAIDEGIYVERGVYVREAGRLNTIRMLLHEYSHHVQNRVGILGDDKYGREPVPVISRRVELQASCWTGMHLRGSRWLDWDEQDERWLERFNSVDSDELHGDAASRWYWYEQGRTGSTFAACNTWLADRDLVS